MTETIEQLQQNPEYSLRILFIFMLFINSKLDLNSHFFMLADSERAFLDESSTEISQKGNKIIAFC